MAVKVTTTRRKFTLCGIDLAARVWRKRRQSLPKGFIEKKKQQKVFLRHRNVCPLFTAAAVSLDKSPWPPGTLTSRDCKQYQQNTCLQFLHIICAQPASRSMGTRHVGQRFTSASGSAAKGMLWEQSGRTRTSRMNTKGTPRKCTAMTG